MIAVVCVFGGCSQRDDPMVSPVVDSLVKKCPEGVIDQSGTIDLAPPTEEPIAIGTLRDPSSTGLLVDWFRSTDGMLFGACFRVSWTTNQQGEVLFSTKSRLSDSDLREMLDRLRATGYFEELRRKP